MFLCFSLLSHACYMLCQCPLLNCYLEHDFHIYHGDNGTPVGKFYYWQLHIGQQYKGITLLPFRSNNYANTPQCFVIRSSSIVFYLTRCTTYSIATCHAQITSSWLSRKCHVTKGKQNFPSAYCNMDTRKWHNTWLINLWIWCVVDRASLIQCG
jgi:hypothetical protein